MSQEQHIAGQRSRPFPVIKDNELRESKRNAADSAGINITTQTTLWMDGWMEGQKEGNVEMETDRNGTENEGEGSKKTEGQR